MGGVGLEVWLVLEVGLVLGVRERGGVRGRFRDEG